MFSLMTNTAPKTNRHLVLIDIENFLGTPSPTSADVELAQSFLAAELSLCGDEQIVVACSHHAAPEVAFGWVGPCRRKWRSGIDGADLALLEVLATEPVVGRFDELTVVSGDGIFTDAVAALSASGIKTHVVSLPGHLSRRLRLACRHVHEIENAPWAPVSESAA